MAAVEHLPVLYHSADYISFPWNHWAHCIIFENEVLLMYTIEGVSIVANFATAYEGLNKTETPIFLPVVCSLFPKAIFFTFIILLTALKRWSRPYKRYSKYPNISKCNAKSCTCCNHLICQSTIISSVNYRQFSSVNNSDLDWKSEDVIYVLTCREGVWGMQYAGQTKRALKTRFKEHLLKIKKNSEKLYVSLSTFPENLPFMII